jgi:hypothetical protein
MSSTYSNSLRVELIGSGDQAGTWGQTTDNNFAYIFDTAIAGYQAVTVTSTAQALTYVSGPTSSAALNQSVYAMLKFNSASAATAIYAPPVSKQYILWNNTSYAITIYNSTAIGNTTAAGTGIAIAAGDKVMVWSDGTNFYDFKSSNVTGTVAIANGGTNSTATPTNGGIGYGTGTAHAYTAVGTSGQVVVSAGAAAPAFGVGAATTPSAVTFSATAMTVNCALSNVFTTTFTANVTVAPTFSNPIDGQTINWFITQDATGSRTITWPSSFKWAGGSTFIGVLSTSANAVDLLVATYRSSTGFWYASLSKGFA